jgi:hypothetical protein
MASARAIAGLRLVLAVDWVPSRPERPEGLVVVYDGGVLSDAEIKGIGSRMVSSRVSRLSRQRRSQVRPGRTWGE